MDENKITRDKPESKPELKPKLSFKERWLLEDKKCEKCGQVTERVRGITKQNIKRLIIPQFNWNEIFITGLLILVIVISLLYQSETKECKEWVNVFKGDVGTCKMNCNNQCDLLNRVQYSNLANLTGLEQLNITRSTNLAT